MSCGVGDKVIGQEQMNKLRHIGSLAFSRFETVCSSYELAIRAIEEEVPGDFVECGIANGSQIAAMAYACIHKNADKDMWLYDSYCGIPMAGPEDTQQPGIGAIDHDVNVPSHEFIDRFPASSQVIIINDDETIWMYFVV